MIEQVPGWKHVYSGKVRDLYESEDPELSHLILIVASDRISAFDNILDPAIPGKGENLTAVTNFWFDKLAIANHRSFEVPVPKEVFSRGTIAKKLKMFPIECVVRGYISGSGYKEYLEQGGICGIQLPAGLSDGEKLPEPIFTPAFKAELGEHDENISFEKVIEIVGEKAAKELRETSIAVFKKASAIAEAAGLILADTKFEFGTEIGSEQLVLADEVLTPDSSRYWDKKDYEVGSIESFDKQLVRNWLLENWDPTGTSKPPVLPPEIVELASSRYTELREKLEASTE